YVVTTNRLIFKRGIINRNSHELLLKKCEGVQVDQSIPGRIFDYGTVVVTTGEVTNSYKYISHPLRFTTKIHEQISKLKDV
ncbi:MAG: PH domain-containing protein, partial [Muribaculaceae bacterium]|nr:PH domain-containing protein [Muribaculaceae bacterium]